MNRTQFSKLIAILILLFSFSSCKQKKNYKVFNNHIQLEGEDNMRDLGGFIGKDGRRILYRKLFRSGELNELTTADKDSLLSFQIEQIIDLRTASKRKEAPNNIPNEITNYHLPLLNIDVDRKLISQILKKQVNAKDFMLNIYQEIDSLKIANWTKIFDYLESNKVTLWHCSSGKDRAGMTTALVLASLGVEKKEIVKDYIKSNNYLSANNNKIKAVFTKSYGKEAAELFWPILTVQQEYIDVFLTTINKKYGGIEQFMEILDVDVQKMRENYLEK